MSDGFFLMHRGWRDNPVFRGEYSRGDAWMWLIENAAWKPVRVRIKGAAVELARGELSFSQRFLAEKWGWSKSRVDRFIAELRAEGMIETRSKIGATADHTAGQGRVIITICNYAKYQDKTSESRGNDNEDSGAIAGQQRGKEEQGNKGTSDEEAKASPSQRARKPFRMPADWVPGPLPPDIAELVAQWPPGRFAREAENTRDYWLDRTEKRPGWDRTFHNRIRDIHERVLRDGRNSRPANFQSAAGNRGTRASPLIDILAACRAEGAEDDPGDDHGAWPPLRAIGSGC